MDSHSNEGSSGCSNVSNKLNKGGSLMNLYKFWFIAWFIHSFVRPFLCLFLCSFLHSIILSFVHLFISFIDWSIIWLIAWCVSVSDAGDVVRLLHIIHPQSKSATEAASSQTVSDDKQLVSVSTQYFYSFLSRRDASLSLAVLRCALSLSLSLITCQQRRMASAPSILKVFGVLVAVLKCYAVSSPVKTWRK